MNSGFTGSSSLEDRRRRRLLSEQVEDGMEESALVVSRGIAESSRNHRYPMKRIIHYKVWRLWLMEFGMVCLLSALLYGIWSVAQKDLGPGLQMLFDQDQGRLIPACYAALLLMAAQISWFIGWARSRGPNDFHGRYRVWSPIGLLFSLSSLCVIVRADEILNASLQHAGIVMPWEIAAWNWLIPVAGLSVLFLWIVNAEMRTSRTARIHLWLGIAGLAAGLSLPYFPMINSTYLVMQGLTLGGVMLVCQSLVWFGRHVLYVSADPADRKPSWILKSLKALFQQRDISQDDEKIQDISTDQREVASTTSKPKTSSRRRGRKKKPVVSKNSSSSESVSSSDLESDTEDPVEENETNQVPPTAEKPRIRLNVEDITVSSVDAEILQERIDMMELLAEEGEEFDQELLKGLTKKQKKQMRSAWRGLEREYSTRRAG